VEGVGSEGEEGEVCCQAEFHLCLLLLLIML